jgi:hypothetical protein
MPAPDPKLDHLLRTAIEQTRLLQLRYRNKNRIVEPHDYGQHNGVTKLLTWQIGGSSSGSFAPQLALDGNRPDLLSTVSRPDLPRRMTHAFGKHHKWDKLVLRVNPPANTPG